MRRLVVVLLIVAACVWPFLYFNRYFLHIGVMMGIMATLALSVNLLLRIGQLSMAHAAFMGLGAYISALLTLRLHVPFAVAFLGSGVLVALFARVLGPVVLRIKGVYFVLLTFALGEVINLIFQAWVELFGGNNGLFGIPKASLFGVRMLDIRFYYLAGLALTGFAYATVRALFRSDAGAILDSLDENETLASSLSTNTAMRQRIAVFVLSSFLAALSGSLYAHYLGFISPDAFSFWTVVNVVVINVIGGIASPLGPVLGALLLVPLPELLRDAKQYQVLSYGVLLIVFLLFLPDGLVGLRRRITGR
jgi:branched-chain amino acid transport system permease protein